GGVRQRSYRRRGDAPAAGCDADGRAADATADALRRGRQPGGAGPGAAAGAPVAGRRGGVVPRRRLADLASGATNRLELTLPRRPWTPAPLVEGTPVTTQALPALSSPPLPLTNALEAAADALLQRQQTDGHWVGELEGDTILESEYVLLLAFLGEEGSEVVRKAAAY